MADIVTPPVGSNAYYSFTRDFQSLNGIYRLGNILTWGDLVSLGVDIFESLFAPLELDRLLYQELQSGFINARFLKIENTNQLLRNETNVDEYYIPETILNLSPNTSNIRLISNMVMLLDLGEHDQEETYVDLLEQVARLCSNYSGRTIDPSLGFRNRRYVTEEDFQRIENDRQDRVSNLRDYNLYRVIVDKNRQIADLEQRNKLLEEAYLNLNDRLIDSPDTPVPQSVDDLQGRKSFRSRSEEDELRDKDV